MSTVEEELQKKPKTNSGSLFDTTEIEYPLSSDEPAETNKNDDNGIDDKIFGPKEKDDLHFNNDLQEGSSLHNEDSQLRSRCTKRPNRQRR